MQFQLGFFFFSSADTHPTKLIEIIFRCHNKQFFKKNTKLKIGL